MPAREARRKKIGVLEPQNTIGHAERASKMVPDRCQSLAKGWINARMSAVRINVFSGNPKNVVHVCVLLALETPLVYPPHKLTCLACHPYKTSAALTLEKKRRQRESSPGIVSK